MEDKLLNEIKRSSLSEKEKLEMIFNRYVDMDSGIMHMNVDDFDKLLEALIKFNNIKVYKECDI